MPMTSRKQPDLRERRTSGHVLPARVVIVSDAIAERNGVGTYYQDLVQQLEGRVEHVALIAPSASSPVRHERFSIPMPGDTTQRLVYPKVAALKRLVDSVDPQVAVIPTLGPYAYYALRMARRRRMRICVAHHTNFEALASLYWNPLVSRVCRLVLQSMTNRLIRHADMVATMNLESLEDAQRRGARHVRRMGTPVATSFLRAPRQPLEMDPPRVIFLGRLAEEKGIEQVLQAAERLPEYQFRIGGDGPLRKRVETEAARRPNLEFLGWLTRAQVLQAIDTSDLLVLPSRLEAFGTVALEALARHRLVLVTRDCGVADCPALAEGLFTMQDGEDMTATLQRVANLAPWQRESIAAKGWKAVEQFNEDTIQGWIHALAELVGVAWPVSKRLPAVG